MVANGKTHNEIESVYYLQLNAESLEALKKANHTEKHEQWQVKGPRGNVRVRAIDDKEYIMTIKKEGGENEFPIKKDSFLMFKGISDRGMFKQRYTFDIDVSAMSPFHRAYWRGLKWEVDVFILPDGKIAPWCKVDLEVNTGLQKQEVERPKLPIPYVRILTEKAGDKEAVSELYGKYFLRSQ
jgi:hypothetical protein